MTLKLFSWGWIGFIQVGEWWRERERERERSRIGKGVPGGGNSINDGPGICWEAETLGELEHQEGEGGATGKVTHLNSEYSEGWARWGGSVETVDLCGQILLLFPWQVLNCLLCVLVAQSCPTLCDPMDCSPPGSSVHGIYQTRILQLVAIPFYRVSSQPRDETQVSCIAGRIFIIWATRKIPTWLRW